MIGAVLAALIYYRFASQAPMRPSNKEQRQ
jgi:hypothetical protein